MMVERDPLALQSVQQLELVLVALLPEVVDRAVPRDLLAPVRRIAPGELDHLLLDRAEVVRRQRMLAQVDVVVEAGLDRRADAELRPGEERFHRFCHQVGGAVPVGVLALVVRPREDPHRGIGGERACEIARLAVDADGERLPGQARADALRDGLSGDAAGILALRSVGQCDGDGVHDLARKKIVPRKHGMGRSCTTRGRYRSRTCDLYHVKVAL